MAGLGLLPPFVRRTLQAAAGLYSNRWPSVTRSTSTSRRSISSPSRSASTARRRGGSPTLASRVAEMLGVSRASAGEMLKRLEKEGLVRRGEHKEALLTPSGRKRAEKVVRKHRIVERLLTDFMGYTAGEAHVYADDIGETFSDDMVERMEEKLGYPGPLPARLAGRPGLRAGGEQRARSARRARGPAKRRRSCGSPSTTASSCTGSTTRATSRGRRSSSATLSPPPGSSR